MTGQRLISSMFTNKETWRFTEEKEVLPDIIEMSDDSDTESSDGGNDEVESSLKHLFPEHEVSDLQSRSLELLLT